MATTATALNSVATVLRMDNYVHGSGIFHLSNGALSKLPNATSYKSTIIVAGSPYSMRIYVVGQGNTTFESGTVAFIYGFLVFNKRSRAFALHTSNHQVQPLDLPPALPTSLKLGHAAFNFVGVIDSSFSATVTKPPFARWRVLVRSESGAEAFA